MRRCATASGYLSTALIDTAFIGVPDVVAIAPWVVGGVVARGAHLRLHPAEVPACLGGRAPDRRRAAGGPPDRGGAVCALALGVTGAVSSAADTGDEKRAVDQQIEDIKGALAETSADLANAYNALQSTQSQLPAAQAALAQAEEAERTANQHNDEVAAQLAVAQANEQRAWRLRPPTRPSSTRPSRSSTTSRPTSSRVAGRSADVRRAGGHQCRRLRDARCAGRPGHLADRQRAQGAQNARAEASAQESYLRAVEAEVAQLKREAEESLAQAQAARTAASTAKANLDNLLAQQSAYAADVESKKAAELRRLAAAEAEQARLQATLEAQARAAAAAEAARAAAARAAGRAYTPVTGGTGFLSHAANGPITSQFGLRFHPILHVWKLHTGTDFGVPCGTPVMAAADGTVISAGYGGGNGNRIVIDHGIVSGVGLASTYNHLSAFVVKSGKVKRGQLIALSGTTGYSTGCHLHFETLENGQFVNPMKWL